MEVTRNDSFDAGDIAGIVAAASVALTAFVTGLWQWMSNRHKANMDAQGSLLNGFIQLINEFKAEREAFINRINQLEALNLKQDRHIFRLERIIIQNGIEIVEEKNETNNNR